jgi:hypothetical protein
MRGAQEKMTSDLGVGYGEHRRAEAQTSCDSSGSSYTGHPRTEPLLITGDKTRDAAIGAPRIRAGEIIGWRFWKLRNGLLYSVFVPYTWHLGVFERSSSKESGFKNPGYYAFKDKEQAEHEASIHAYGWPFAFGSPAQPYPCDEDNYDRKRQTNFRDVHGDLRSSKRSERSMITTINPIK